MVFRPAIPFVQYNLGHLPSFSRDLQQACLSSRSLSRRFSFPQVPQEVPLCAGPWRIDSLGLGFLCVRVLQSVPQHGRFVCWNRRSVETHTRSIPLSVNGSMAGPLLCKWTPWQFPSRELWAFPNRLDMGPLWHRSSYICRQ